MPWARAAPEAPEDVAEAAKRVIEAGLLEPDPNRNGGFRLSYEAQERRKRLQKELAEIVGRLGKPEPSKQVVPVALRLNPEPSAICSGR